MPALYILFDEHSELVASTPLPLVWTMYGLSLAIFIIAIRLAIKTRNLRKRVEDKYKINASMLEEWERALELVKSYEDEEVLLGLDTLHALNVAQNKFWDRHVFEAMKGHKNQQIADKAKFIYEKLATSTTKPPAPAIDKK